MRPYLFLDVDGVLNRISSTGDTWPDFELHKLEPFNRGVTYHLYLSKQMCAALSNLKVDIIWLTTWCEEAPRLVAPCVGLGEYPVAGYGDDLTGRKYSKVGCLEDFMDENGKRPFIWIDDDSIPNFAKVDFEEQGYKCLFIEPDEREGLLPDHIEEIEFFLKNLIK